jgi:hypothetical protein
MEDTGPCLGNKLAETGRSLRRPPATFAVGTGMQGRPQLKGEVRWFDSPRAQPRWLWR